MATSTPWGPSQFGQRIAPGITFYSTARHGGIKLSRGRLAEMPESLASIGGRISGWKGWFEEDCEIAAVVVAFPKYFPEEIQQTTARQTLKAVYNIEVKA